MDILIPLLIGVPVIAALAIFSYHRNRLNKSAERIEEVKGRIRTRATELAFADTVPNDRAGVTVTELSYDAEQQMPFELVDYGFWPSPTKTPGVVRGPSANTLAGVPLANSVLDDRNQVPSIDDAWRSAR